MTAANDTLAPPAQPWQQEAVAVEAGMAPWLIALIEEANAAAEEARNNLDERIRVARGEATP